MDYVAQTGCPDILLSRSEGEDWLFCPISQEAREWAEENLYLAETEGRNRVVRGFSYVCELFDSLTDSGLTVR